MKKSGFLEFKFTILLSALALSLFIFSCANLQSLVQQMSVKQPRVEVVGARLKSLSFSGAGLAFDVRVQNPNPVGIDLKEFHYQFLLNERPFLSGDKTESLKIEANGSNTIQIPLAFTFENIYKTWKNLRDKDTTRYQLKGDFAFNLPVLGRVSIPASKSGILPLAKIPKIKIKALHVKNLDFSKADFELVFQLTNPNGFSLDLKRMKYALQIAGKNWVSGESAKEASISPKGKSNLTIPVSVHFSQIGHALYSSIVNGKKLPYDFSGKINFSSSLPVLKNVDFPFKKKGILSITR